MMRAVAAQLGDRRFLAWSATLGLAVLVAFGLVSAIIPNPVFGRSVAAEPFAVAVWVASAPLIGIILATYVLPPAGPSSAPTRQLRKVTAAPEDGRGGILGSVGGFAAFLAIGCPVCNKVALLLLGTSGAMSVWAPLQPVVGAASLGLLAATAVWRLRTRSRGGVCAIQTVDAIR